MNIQQIHHVAYRCRDAKQTVDFYKQVLNMDLLGAIAEDRVPSTKAPDPYMHIFLDAGAGNILAFFELPNSPPMGRDPNTPDWTQHIALQVKDMDELLEAKTRAEAAGLDVIGPTDHTIFQSIYFWDPSGHRLEVATWTTTPEQLERMRAVAHDMVEEWSRTKSPPRHTAWLHEKGLRRPETTADDVAEIAYAARRLCGLRRTAMDIIEAIHGRRSVRSYVPKPVDRGLIESVILDAAQAPPPFRGQNPLAFNVVQGVERIATYGTRAMDYARSHRPDESGWSWLERPGFKIFWDAPVLVIISGPVGDCHRAGQNLMLSAHARGLGTCWVGSPMLWLSTPEVRAELKIPSDLMPVAVLCLGHPATVPEATPRERPRIIWSPET